MTRLEELQAALASKEAEYTDIQSEMENFEIEVSDELYDEMLDDCYGEVQIAGLTFSTSYALKELDPTAYDCGKNDYADSLDPSGDPEYQELQERLGDLRDEIAELEAEIEEEITQYEPEEEN
jgi:predicted nuclease with TOPRIM domain